MKTNWFLAQKSFGRFLGEAPPRNQSLLAWVVWGLRMVAYHLPVRIVILPGELPEHDWHHRNPHNPDWSNGIYAREWDREAPCLGLPETYTEIWGLFNAIDHVFECLSKTPAPPSNSEQISAEAIAQVINTM